MVSGGGLRPCCMKATTLQSWGPEASQLTCSLLTAVNGSAASWEVPQSECQVFSSQKMVSAHEEVVSLSGTASSSHVCASTLVCTLNTYSFH